MSVNLRVFTASLSTSSLFIIIFFQALFVVMENWQSNFLMVHEIDYLLPALRAVAEECPALGALVQEADNYLVKRRHYLETFDCGIGADIVKEYRMNLWDEFASRSRESVPRRAPEALNESNMEGALDEAAVEEAWNESIVEATQEEPKIEAAAGPNVDAHEKSEPKEAAQEVEDEGEAQRAAEGYQFASFSSGGSNRAASDLFGSLARLFTTRRGLMVDVVNKAMGYKFTQEDDKYLGVIALLPRLTIPENTLRAEGPLRNIEAVDDATKEAFLTELVAKLADDPRGNIEPELGPGGVVFASAMLD
ncbi:hypothetical protein L596_015779 [Steinernema carpocapsae]|uniref:Uncharacterized protein n=1 Tax=Steinernema carpocapsae TaxID=34508 RepID=A0A4U5NH84_STECR|nr:hypothetical protein L596_015779 [Steinernema carpocapsae]